MLGDDPVAVHELDDIVPGFGAGREDDGEHICAEIVELAPLQGSLHEAVADVGPVDGALACLHVVEQAQEDAVDHGLRHEARKGELHALCLDLLHAGKPHGRYGSRGGVEQPHSLLGKEQLLRGQHALGPYALQEGCRQLEALGREHHADEEARAGVVVLHPGLLRLHLQHERHDPQELGSKVAVRKVPALLHERQEPHLHGDLPELRNGHILKAIVHRHREQREDCAQQRGDGVRGDHSAGIIEVELLLGPQELRHHGRRHGPPPWLAPIGRPLPTLLHEDLVEEGFAGNNGLRAGLHGQGNFHGLLPLLQLARLRRPLLLP
mmetsp:Transcript_101415/g.327266  ORF Transcript_101415/g.327266 Transcript_101415/m.327266 type:complete len:323 (+) Transcript_101415:1424-2392(+)